MHILSDRPEGAVIKKQIRTYKAKRIVMLKFEEPEKKSGSRRSTCEGGRNDIGNTFDKMKEIPF